MQRLRWRNRGMSCLGVVTLGSVLVGCGNMSGLGGSEQYGCKAPAGVQCQSVSGTYHSGLRGTQRLPSAGANGRPTAPTTMTRATLLSSGLGMGLQASLSAGYDPMALRSPPRVMRLWIKPWEDADQDLVDQSYVYVRIHQGKWMMDHVQRQVREAYAPLRPPALAQGASSESSVSPVASPVGDQSHGGRGPLQQQDSAGSAVAIGGR